MNLNPGEEVTGREGTRTTTPQRKKRKAHNKEFYDKVWATTNGVCHVCGMTNLTCEPRNWQADHIVPFDRDGDDEDPANFLPVCGRCNRLRWHNAPGTMRRILFLGVVANSRGYQFQKEWASDAEAIRKMRRDRLIDNWKRRKKKQFPLLTRDEINNEAGGLDRGFHAFEQEVARRVEQLPPDRNRWTEMIEKVQRESKFRLKWEAYWELAKRESPGEFERETHDGEYGPSKSASTSG